MAILKTITDNKGVVTSYHRIGAFAVSVPDSKVYVNLFGYTDATYREQEKADADKDLHVTNTAVALDLFADDTYTRAKLYEAIMALPEFEESTAV